MEELRKQNRPTAPPATRVAEQRRAKLKERLETSRAKRAEGKLSTEEEQPLERLEAAMRFMRAHLLPDKAATAPAEKPAKN